MRIFYSIYTGLTIAWDNLQCDDSKDHPWYSDNTIGISFAGNQMWHDWGLKCFTSWTAFKMFITEIFWLPYVYSSWKDHEVAHETKYVWLLFMVYVDIERLENVKARWVKT